MKILLVHSYLYPNGGDSIYTIRLGKLLESKGHKVAYFGMKNDKNFQHEYSDYEVNFIDYSLIARSKKPRDIFTAITKPIYSLEAKKNNCPS